MLVDIQIEQKTLDARLTFDLSHFKDIKSIKDSLAIITMIAGDYSLDPEFEVEDLEGIIAQGKEKEANHLVFNINEDEMDAEFL